MFQRRDAPAGEEVDEIYRRGSGIVCAWADVRTLRNQGVIWLGSHQDFISRSPRSPLSIPIRSRTILIALLSRRYFSIYTPCSPVSRLTSRAIGTVDCRATGINHLGHYHLLVNIYMYPLNPYNYECLRFFKSILTIEIAREKRDGPSVARRAQNSQSSFLILKTENCCPK